MKQEQLPLPLCCTLIGGLWVICWAMVYRQSEIDPTRVTLEQSVPLLPLGLSVGFCGGWLLRWFCRASSTLAKAIPPMITAALVGSIFGPFGWLARDHRFDLSGSKAILLASSYGTAVGLVLWGVGRVVSSLSHRSQDSVKI